MNQSNPRTLIWLTSASCAVALLTALSAVVHPFDAPANPDDAVVVAGWWTAALLCAWFFASVILWTLALRNPRTRFLWAATRLSLPGTRRLAQSAVSLTLMLASAACSTAGTEAPTLSLLTAGVPTTASTTTALTPSSSTIATEPTPEEAAVEPLEVEPVAEAEPLVEPIPSTYEVQCGDNLWTIATRHLESTLDRTPSSAEIAPYWRDLVTLNQHSLNSGDADLIFPGEILDLPD